MLNNSKWLFTELSYSPLMTVLFSAFEAVGCHAAHREHMFKPSLFHSKGFKEISTSHELSPCPWLSIIALVICNFPEAQQYF